MTAKAVFTAAALALVAAGCAAPPPVRSMRCDTPVCNVAVHVADCRITVDPDTVMVFGRNRQIHWDIAHDSPGYKFAADGITIKDLDPTREFTDPSRPNDTKYIWHDRNSQARSDPYHYGVKVMRGETACPPLDPGIINQG